MTRAVQTVIGNSLYTAARYVRSQSCRVLMRDMTEWFTGCAIVAPQRTTLIFRSRPSVVQLSRIRPGAGINQLYRPGAGRHATDGRESSRDVRQDKCQTASIINEDSAGVQQPPPAGRSTDRHRSLGQQATGPTCARQDALFSVWDWGSNSFLIDHCWLASNWASIEITRSSTIAHG